MYFGTRSKRKNKQGEEEIKDADVHYGNKGFRIYPGPKEHPFEYVRLELEAHTPLIKKLNLKLPDITPYDVNPFNYLDYRKPCNTEQLRKVMLKQHEKARRFNPSKSDLYEAVIESFLSGYINGPPATAGRISNFKTAFPELKTNSDRFFPKWTGKKQQLLSDIEQGFIRRCYD